MAAAVEVVQQPKASSAPSDRSRPSTQAGYRFGQLSRSSFFARHSPHAHRCVHIKGLLGLPIPVVVDDCDHSTYETHLCFPPNGHNDQKLQSQRLLLPVNAIHLNSHRHPLDTINGLQYFTNLKNFSFKEKAVPRLGLVPVTESWREHLRSLTDQTFHPTEQQGGASGGGAGRPDLRREATFADSRSMQQQQQPTLQPPEKPATASRPMYSRQTGRLIPPPSRAMSRKPLRSGHRATPNHVLAGYEHISAAPDLESAVFSMLCQILQTEDTNAVQAWLVSASDREKALVMDVIRSAVANREAYYEADVSGEPFEPSVNIRQDLHLPPIAEAEGAEPKRVDRLVIEDAERDQQSDEQQQQQQQQKTKTEAAASPEKKKTDAKPVAGAKTSKQQQPQKQPQVPQKGQTKTGAVNGKQKKGAAGPKLKYSKHEPSLTQAGKSKDTWRPQESYAA